MVELISLRGLHFPASKLSDPNTGKTIFEEHRRTSAPTLEIIFFPAFRRLCPYLVSWSTEKCGDVKLPDIMKGHPI